MMRTHWIEAGTEFRDELVSYVDQVLNSVACLDQAIDDHPRVSQLRVGPAKPTRVITGRVGQYVPEVGVHILGRVSEGGQAPIDLVGGVLGGFDVLVELRVVPRLVGVGRVVVHRLYSLNQRVHIVGQLRVDQLGHPETTHAFRV